MDPISLHAAKIDPVQSLYKFHTRVDVLRLDLIHPVISGNKWFKLKYHLKEAAELNKKTILTFGGAYSNHIVATAAAAKIQGFNSIGIIRGELPSQLSPSLNYAQDNGMKLFFTTREEYQSNKIPREVFETCSQEDIHFIPEGGYGEKGMQGAMEILELVKHHSYQHIYAATGTGTMLAGLINQAAIETSITGISVLKNNFSIEKEIRNLLPAEKHHRFTISFDHHFGGYAKHKPELLSFMNYWYENTGIPSDFVYTGKLFYAAHQILSSSTPRGDVLLIHSGGLQGNNSLPKGTLIF